MDSSIKYQKFEFTEEDSGVKMSARHESNSTCLTAVLVILSLLAIAVIKYLVHPLASNMTMMDVKRYP